MKYKKFKEVVKQEIKELLYNELNEISQTGNIAGYQTPFAFSGDSDDAREKRKKRLKQMNKQYGYTLVNDVATPEAMQDFYSFFSSMTKDNVDESLLSESVINPSLFERLVDRLGDEDLSVIDSYHAFDHSVIRFELKNKKYEIFLNKVQNKVELRLSDNLGRVRDSQTVNVSIDEIMAAIRKMVQRTL